VSTNIVVDVALAALRQLNQSQVNANRQAKLLADRNSKLAGKAVEADAAAKAQQGRGRDGALLYGIRSDRRRVLQQPVAAYRVPVVATADGWLFVPSDAGFNVATNNISPFAFSDYYINEGVPEGTWGIDFTQFGLGEGPLGSNSFYCSDVRAPGSFDPLYRISIAKAKSGVSQEPAAKEFTFEVLAKLATRTSGPLRPFSGSAAYREDGSWGFSIDQTNYYTGSTYENIGSLFMWYGNIDVEGYEFEHPDGIAGSLVVPGLADTSVWHHMAIVQIPGSSDATRSVSFYFDGVRLLEVIDVPSEDLPSWGSVFDDYDISTDSTYGNGLGTGTGTSGITNTATKLHGLRFTARALYTGATYTPPTSITSLA